MDDTVEEISGLLRRTLRRHALELGMLGEKVRAEIVKPVCKKYKLNFVVGNGEFFFRKKKTKNKGFDAVEPRYGNCEDLVQDVPPGYRGLSDSAKKALKSILALLNEEISHGQYLGYFVRGVE